MEQNKLEQLAETELLLTAWDKGMDEFIKLFRKVFLLLILSFLCVVSVSFTNIIFGESHDIVIKIWNAIEYLFGFTISVYILYRLFSVIIRVEKSKRKFMKHFKICKSDNDNNANQECNL